MYKVPQCATYRAGALMLLSLCFTGEEMVVQRGHQTYPSSHSLEVNSLQCEPR